MSIDGILEPAVVADLVACLQRAAFTDGKATAGWAAQLVKNNEQTAPDPEIEAWCDRITAGLRAHPVFDVAARPKRIIGPLFSRYKAGDSYGWHVDEPVLDGQRADLSFTLFLSDPDTYAGGDLVIETAAGEEAFKLAAGMLVLYPAATLHRVTPVTRGTRYVAAGWVRSLVRRADHRELLFDLETARQRLFAAHGKTPEFDVLSKCAANLMRLWCDD